MSSCRRCPHHVRHGQVAADGQNFVFQDRCGLKMKTGSDQLCVNIPFPKAFEYTECTVYRSTFKSQGPRNDVVPTSDFQYSDALSGQSITEMELL